MKTRLNRFPLASPVAKRVLSLAHATKDDYVLRRLERSTHPQGRAIYDSVAQVANPPPADRIWFHQIEVQRARLELRDEPLADGSLGTPGPYDAELTVSKACAASKPPKPGLMLYLLTKALGSKNALELGTNVGISSAFIAAGQLAAEGGGRLTTLDGSAYRQAVARGVHEALGLTRIEYVSGLFSDTLRPTLERLGSVDLAFIDGHHQYQPTLDYFEAILPFASVDCVFVFDDIRWSDGMKRAWSELQEDDRFGLVVDVGSVGVCARKAAPQSERLVLPPLRRVLA